MSDWKKATWKCAGSIKGEPGKTPIPGVDFQIPKDGERGTDGLNGKDGASGSPDAPYDIKTKLESLKGDDRLDVSAVKGIKEMKEIVEEVQKTLPREIASFKKSGLTAKEVEDFRKGGYKGGGGGSSAPVAPVDATYITQIPNATLTNEQALSLLATGYMKSATVTGVVTTQAIPIPVSDGGTGSTSYAEGAIPFFDTDTNSLEGDATNLKWDEIYNQLTAAAVRPVSGSIKNFYVSTTGNDVNDGLSALTPKLTLDGANGVLQLIPMLAGDQYNVNFVLSGGVDTYQLTAPFEFRPMFSVAGDSDSRTVIKFIGNVADQTKVVIKAVNATSNIFNLTGFYLLLDLDGVTLDTAQIGLNMNGARALLRAVNITNCRGNSILARNGSVVTTDSSAIPCLFSGVLGFTYIGLRADASSTITISKSSTTSQFNGGSRACAALSGSTITYSGAGITTNITADAATGARFGVSAQNGGQVGMQGTTNFNNISVVSSAGDGAIRIFQYGTASLIGGSTYNFTNCHNGFFLSQEAAALEGTTCTYNYISVINKVLIAHSAVVDSTSYLGTGQVVAYTGAILGAPIFGYDDRYVMTSRPTDGRTAVADVSYNVLVSDSQVTYTSLTAARTVTLPTPVASSVGITSGQMRIYRIKDESGNCSAVNTITIQVSGGSNIDGAATYVMDQPYGYLEVYVVSTTGLQYFTKSGT